MRSILFIAAAIVCFTFSINFTLANKLTPFHTQATPLAGITTFDNLYNGTFVDLTGIKSAGVAGLKVANISGYDVHLNATSTVVDCGIGIEPLTGQSALIYGYTQTGATTLASLQISSNDKSYFDLKSVDITVDGLSAGTAQMVRLIGYRNGIPRAILDKMVTSASSGGLLVNFDVSGNSGFKGVTSFGVQDDGTYTINGAIGVDNINAVNFRTLLPVNLISYDALLLQNNTVLLNWRTTNEINNEYFTINKSTDGINFSPLGKVESKLPVGGFTDYSFIDAHPLNGNNFYRLSQVDIDGNQKILSIKKVEVKAKGLTSLYPNPVSGNTITLKYGQGLTSKDSYTIIDASGKMVSSGKIYQLSQTIHLPNMSSGIYTFKLSNGKSIMFEKK